MQQYPNVGDLVWVQLNLMHLVDTLDDEDKDISDWDSEMVLGYVKSYSVDEDTIESDKPDIWACIHVLDSDSVPYQYDYYFNHIKEDADCLQRSIEDFNISWSVFNESTTD